MSTFDFSSFTKKKVSDMSPRYPPSLVKFKARFSQFKQKLQSNTYIKDSPLSLPKIHKQIPELTRRLKKENQWLKGVVAHKKIKTGTFVMTDRVAPTSSLNESVNQISFLFDKLEQDLQDLTLK